MNAPLLAIETSTTTGSVALGSDGAAVEIRLAPPIRHAEALLPAIDYALASAGIAKRALGGVVVGGGPGSFTGLRIAAATAKALVQSLDVPLFAASGLLAQAALLADAGAPVCALFDARRGEVYAACYRFDGATPTALLEPDVDDALAFVDRLRALDPLYVGEGATRNAERLMDAGARLAGVRDPYPSAAALLSLVAAALDHYRVADAAAWQPTYVRASSAERGLSV
ncbi:MAG TPA: tRNA (adenosine(37)-N6)-threonylcarbamoyltransferase complex dimerization subunit type 1 TsaB [Thermoanaerobaculia bacterium]